MCMLQRKNPWSHPSDFIRQCRHACVVPMLKMLPQNSASEMRISFGTFGWISQYRCTCDHFPKLSEVVLCSSFHHMSCSWWIYEDIVVGSFVDGHMFLIVYFCSLPLWRYLRKNMVTFKKTWWRWACIIIVTRLHSPLPNVASDGCRTSTHQRLVLPHEFSELVPKDMSQIRYMWCRSGTHSCWHKALRHPFRLIGQIWEAFS